MTSQSAREDLEKFCLQARASGSSASDALTNLVNVDFARAQDPKSLCARCGVKSHVWPTRAAFVFDSAKWELAFEKTAEAPRLREFHWVKPSPPTNVLCKAKS